MRFKKLSPPLVLWVLAFLGLFSGVAMIWAAAQPEVLTRLMHNRDPIDLGLRLAFLRNWAVPGALVLFGYAVLHRQSQSWLPVQKVLFVLPVAAFVLVIGYKMSFGIRDWAYLRLIREDGPVEYVSAIVFFIAAAFAARATMLTADPQSRFLGAVFALGLFFIAFSEVSFGQRIFGWQTPEGMARVNRQQETTLHNIEGVEYVVYNVLPFIILAYGLFSRMAARALARSKMGRNLSAEVLEIAPAPWYSVPYLAVMVIACQQAQFVADEVWQDQEPAELLMAIGFMLVAIRAWSVVASARKFNPPEPLRSSA